MNAMVEKPVTIAVIADTHVNRLDELPPELLATLDSVDYIVHLGDFTSPEILADLKSRRNFKGVWGNHDRLPVMRQRLNRLEILEIDGKKLGLVHGTFYPVGRQRRLKAWFKQHQIDILLFGHSHVITSKTLDGVFLFNPGSVTCKFPANFGSYGILTLNGTVTSKIITINNNIPLGRKLLIIIPAWIIREGTSFLESWPYIDTSRPWALMKAIAKKSTAVIRRSRKKIKVFAR
jgi:uncharacterized protein